MAVAGWILCVLTASTCGAASKTWVGNASGAWTNDVNWSGSAAPTGGDEVILTNAGVIVTLDTSTPDLGSLVISNAATLVFANWTTALSATNITVGANGTITATGPFSNTTMSNRVHLVCESLLVDVNGAIDVNAKGYAGGRVIESDGQGPGKGKGQYSGAGGSHGGVGGGADAISYTLGHMPGYSTPYGNPATPYFAGSGGGQGVGNTYYGGNGGGVVRVDAPNGIVTVHGTISANGGAGAGTAGGGAGGSIFVSCRTIAGSGGAMSANGGHDAANHLGAGGGGAGGRIAVNYDVGDQASVPDVRFSVEPGRDRYPRGEAEPGTLWFPNALFVTETITRLSGRLVIPGFNAWSPSNLTVSNCWVRFGTNAFELTVANDVTIEGTSGNYGGRLDVGGWGYGAGIGPNVGYHRGMNETTAALTVGGDLILNGGDLAVYSGPLETPGSAYGSLVQVGGDMILQADSWVYPWSTLGTDADAGRGSPKFTMRHLQVADGSGFDADYKGFAGRTWIGIGPGYGQWTFNGGTYGGRGANTNENSRERYDTVEQPRGPGSSGYAISGYIVSGAGGGTVWIEARGNVTLDGILSARGLKPQTYGNLGGNIATAGGGSGGAIYVSCRRFTARETGVVQADGGNGNNYYDSGRSGGGGGGGRIALWSTYRDVAPAATVTVAGGVGDGTDPNTQTAEDGTIHYGQLPFEQTVIILR